MVIRMTSMVEVSIQEVSPLSNAGSGSAAWATEGSSARAASGSSAATPRVMECAFFMSSSVILCRCGGMSERLAPGLAGADPDHLLEVEDEDLAVADLP